jgi:hypothetical protein
MHAKKTNGLSVDMLGGVNEVVTDDKCMIGRRLVTNVVYSYIKTNDLYEDKKKRKVYIPDEALKTLLSITEEDRPLEFTSFQWYVSRLFPKQVNATVAENDGKKEIRTKDQSDSGNQPIEKEFLTWKDDEAKLCLLHDFVTQANRKKPYTGDLETMVGNFGHDPKLYRITSDFVLKILDAYINDGTVIYIGGVRTYKPDAAFKKLFGFTTDQPIYISSIPALVKLFFTTPLSPNAKADEDAIESDFVVVEKKDESEPSKVVKYEKTALLGACTSILSRQASLIIDSDWDSYDEVDSSGNTALTLACKNNMNEVALSIIASKFSMYKKKNVDEQTALMYAVTNKMTDVALAIVLAMEK